MPPREAVLLVPGSIDAARTGGYEYDRQIVHGLRARGWRMDVGELDASFPFPAKDARETATKLLASLPDGALVIVDGLALGALPDEARREADRLRIVALVHHPLARETGLERSVADALAESERRALAAVRRVIVTSVPTVADVAAYGVPRDRVTVVEPGTPRAPLARGSGGAHVHFLCVATVTPRKGHDILIQALAKLREDPWELTCAGSLERDPAMAARVTVLVGAARLESRVHLIGELGSEALAEQYDRADVFVLPTWHEGYGMAVAEALARGLPVISTSTGAIPALLRDQAGILVKAGDVEALTEALGAVIRDAALRARLSAGARSVRERLHDWPDAAARMEEALDAVQR